MNTILSFDRELNKGRRERMYKSAHLSLSEDKRAQPYHKICRQNTTSTAQRFSPSFHMRRCLGNQLMRHINRDASSGSRNHGTVTDSALNATLQATKGSGRPLAAPTKTFMEASFGMNLDGVRLHTDHRAEEMSRSLGAAAFTYGRNIYFNSGQYNPDNTKGTKLLAHELVHTVQQGFHDRPITRDIPISSPGEPEERQAESISAGVVGNASRNSERVLKSVNGIKTQRIQPKIQMARNVDVAVYETKDHGAGYDDAPSETFKLEANSIKEAGSKLNTFIKVARRMFDSSTAINKLSFYGHGAPGFQSVGAGEGYDSAKEISVDSINAFPDDYKQIYAPLSNGANFYLRGCNVGAGAKGLEVLKKIKTSCKTLAGKDIEAYGWTGKSYHHRVLAVDWYEQTGQRVSSSDKSPKITWEKLKKKGAGKK